jgi:type VI secretion system protein ImpI
MPIESLAFNGLKELASSLVPGVPLSTPGEIARLLTKLHDTVEVFCRCFAPLRAGYEQFASSMDLVRAASQRSLNRSPTGTRVEMARDPASLASALLDWRSRDFDGPEVLEAIVADLIAHQTAILGSVMTGVHALLDEIGPAKIQENVQSGRHTLLLGRYRALWEAFKAAHDALSDQTRVFDLVFGPDFASEYRKQLSQQRDPPSRSP